MTSWGSGDGGRWLPLGCSPPPPRLPLGHPRLPSAALGRPRPPSAALGRPRPPSAVLGRPRPPSSALSRPWPPPATLGRTGRPTDRCCWGPAVSYLSAASQKTAVTSRSSRATTGCITHTDNTYHCISIHTPVAIRARDTAATLKLWRREVVGPGHNSRIVDYGRP